MSERKKSLLEEFTAKAIQRLHDRTVTKTERYHIPSMDAEVTIRSISMAEFDECQKIGEDDSRRGDLYGIYLAVADPDLKELGRQLKMSGEIAEPLEVANIFTPHEITGLMTAIMTLSGFMGENIRKVDPLKN